ncbi:Uncharacterised protein [Mycobacterium tuberculosis]|uniref:Uncharacterized protein n=1 Tax=Mycobacterium tuberculosis TaxID=1773 RepID=A0A654TGQ5_MYCTX|nr:Uncharacterised protein [Mycobacterium tuberculosis]
MTHPTNVNQKSTPNTKAPSSTTATPDEAPTMSKATHAGPSGGVGAAARIGSAGISPPKTANELNVAKPM